MLTIEYAKWQEFLKLWHNGKFHPALRFGQALHQFLDLQKTIQFVKECDKLYQLDGEEAHRYALKIFNFS